MAKLRAVISKGHTFQFFGENYTTALALKVSSYVSDHKQKHNTGLLRMGSGPGEWRPDFLLRPNLKAPGLQVWPNPCPTNNLNSFYWLKRSYKAHRNTNSRTDPFHVKAPASQPKENSLWSRCFKLWSVKASCHTLSQSGKKHASPSTAPQMTKIKHLHSSRDRETSSLPQSPSENQQGQHCSCSDAPMEGTWQRAVGG